jgi:hypothetical protein
LQEVIPEKSSIPTGEKEDSKTIKVPSVATTSNIVKFGPPRITNKEDLLKLDLNSCSDELNRRAKEVMEEEFVRKCVRPGDQGFQWDKPAEFNPSEPTDWDDEDE